MYSMTQAYNVPDPSAQVPNHILAHVHLVSSYRFPTIQNLQPAQALEYLIKGPQIVRDTSPVAWTFFTSPPPDGTAILTWQPPRMQTHFASDGMVWADAETVYDMNVRGYTLQVLVHNSGYQYPHEPYAMHARFRYRIAAGPGTVDPNLWLVHYRPSEMPNRVLASQIPLPREIQSQLQMRAQLQAAGPLMRKEFMLVDQANWPKVEFGQQAMRGQQAYYNPMQPGRPYIPQPPPAKRPRLPAQPQVRPPMPGTVLPDTSLEEEENATQDAFDFLTPREISLSRYKQHHEWMEEIFSSPHSAGKIAPIDLGLGLMGELAPLTAGILDAPGSENPAAERENYKIKNYYKLEPEQLKDFEKRVAEYNTKEQTHIDELKAEHAKKMAQFKRTRTHVKAERRLRDLVRVAGSDPEGVDSIEEVAQDLEKSLGMKIEVKKLVVCVDKGGYIEAQQPPSSGMQLNGNGAQQDGRGTSLGLNNVGGLGDNSAAGLLDHLGPGSLSGNTVGNISLPRILQPRNQSQPAAGTPSGRMSDLGQPAAFHQHDTSLDVDVGDDLLDLDVAMSGVTGGREKGEEWVMVGGEANRTQSTGGNGQPSSTNANPTTTTAKTLAGSTAEAETGSMFDTADFADFDNLDSAGDALADFGNENIGLDLVDDSAFGDAFHGTELHHGETGDGGQA